MHDSLWGAVLVLISAGFAAVMPVVAALAYVIRSGQQRILAKAEEIHIILNSRLTAFVAATAEASAQTRSDFEKRITDLKGELGRLRADQAGANPGPADPPDPPAETPARRG